jgi:hypothetical protein
MSEDSGRYPDNQREYCQSVGRLLPAIVAAILRDLGFRVWVNEGQSNGVDLKAFDKKDNLVFVAEITNWSSFTRMSEERKNWIISNLSQYECNKVLIYTALENESILSDLSFYGISLLKTGYQVLPENYYEHYARKNQVIRRRIDSEETRENIKSKIENYLRNSQIEIPPCLSNMID